MSCCFSGFKQLFASGQEFTYGLHEIGTYYQDYIELMRHWDTVLPGKVLRVHYDDVVNNLEGEVERILDYCELPFESSCVEFHRNPRAVRTPSSEQVRQPIYRQALEQWKFFEPWLTPLKEALGPAFWSLSRPKTLNRHQNDLDRHSLIRLAQCSNRPAMRTAEVRKRMHLLCPTDRAGSSPCVRLPV